MSIITVTVVQASKKSVHIEMTASLLHVCYLYRTRKQERKTCSVYILIAQVQGRIKRYRGGGEGEARDGGGGGGLGDDKDVQVADKYHNKVIQQT